MSFNFNQQKKSYSFWLSLASAVLLLIQAIGKPLGLEINEEIYMSVINAVLGIFVVLGIITFPTNTNTENVNKNDNVTYITEENLNKQDNAENSSNKNELNKE